jgi:hypothetical protein
MENVDRKAENHISILTPSPSVIARHEAISALSPAISAEIASSHPFLAMTE